MTRRRILIRTAAVVVGVAALLLALIVFHDRRSPEAGARYVALGSSFAAGMGLGTRAPGSPLLSQRSINGYPRLLARMLRISSFTDMSSSGSTVRQVLSGGQLWLGPQVEALGPTTRLVTLTAGGNDVGYVGDLMGMAYRDRGGLTGAVAEHVWSEPRPVGARDFAALDAAFGATLREIHRRSPTARIVVATYPTILPPSGTCAALGITAAQAATMRPVGERLAAVTRAATARAGATLVDIAMLSHGHDACSARPWVTGGRPNRGAMFHPTLAGTTATAHAIAVALREGA